MLSINTNLSSLIAQRSMKQFTNKLNQAIERMTTGAKINHAKDNAANYNIATNMTTKIGALQVAEDNCAMGLDMLTMANDTLTQMYDYAMRLRALSVQALNGTYGAQSLSVIQSEANSIYSEINRIYSTARYNGISVAKKYDIPDYLPKANEETGFIADPYDYTEEEVAQMTCVADVDIFIAGQKYSISTPDELKKLSDKVNAGNDMKDVTFVLANDINLSCYSEGVGWVPIGQSSSTPFRGFFNGNGCMISNLTINNGDASKFTGLFGTCYGYYVIKNLGLEEVNIVGQSRVGALVGSAASGGSIIENCYSTGNIHGEDFVGGLIGYSECANTYDVYSAANVEGIENVGGLAGHSHYEIINSFATGNVHGVINVGGLLGYIVDSTGNFIENSYCTGDVTALKNVGGLIGMIFNASTNPSLHLENVSSFSNVNGKIACGSFVGRLEVKESETSTDYINLSASNCSTLAQGIENFGDSYLDDSDIETNYDLTEINKAIKLIACSEKQIQVGIGNTDSSRITIDTTFDCSLSSIIRNGIGSEKTLNAIDEFLNLMSEKQTELGSAQNRLNSALDEISTQYENLVSSCSTLRDADIAEVSSEYIRQQILQQASATLLATANQSPSIALQLI